MRMIVEFPCDVPENTGDRKTGLRIRVPLSEKMTIEVVRKRARVSFPGFLAIGEDEGHAVVTSTLHLPDETICIGAFLNYLTVED